MKRVYTNIPGRVRILIGLLCVMVGASVMMQPTVPEHVHGSPDAAANGWMPGGWSPSSISRQGGTVSGSFLETFNGAPTSPTAYRPTGWDVDIHSRDSGTWDALESTEYWDGSPVYADHGIDCGPPPLQHDPGGTYPPHVFQCSNHLMTMIQANGYGVIYVTPPALLDWTNTEATLQFAMSTHSTSGRDWVDVWLTPYDEAPKLPLDNNFPVDLVGSALNTVHLRMADFVGQRTWTLVRVDNGVETNIGTPWGFTWPGIEGVLAATGVSTSASRRDIFQLKVSNTHVGFAMPQYAAGANMFDTTLGSPLPFTRALVQFGHHSYFPQKGCEGLPDPDPLTGQPPLCPQNTWHWDDVSLSPAVPIKITGLTPRHHSNTSGTDTWTFPPGGVTNNDTTLRFSCSNCAPGNVPSVEVAFSGGSFSTYTPVTTVDAAVNGYGKTRSYTVAVPNGATSARVRGTPSDQEPNWQAKDAALYVPYDTDAIPQATATALPAGTATAVAATRTAVASITPVLATNTPVPTLTPQATATAGATPTTVPTLTPTVVPTPIPGSSVCQVPGLRDNQPSFVPWPFCNQ